MSKPDVTIPPRTDSHCTQDEAWAEFVRQYEGQPRTMPNISDFALANAVFMADRNDLNLIVYQSAAKERIRWLSIAQAKAAGLLQEAVKGGHLPIDLEERVNDYLRGPL